MLPTGCKSRRIVQKLFLANGVGPMTLSCVEDDEEFSKPQIPLPDHEFESVPLRQQLHSFPPIEQRRATCFGSSGLSTRQRTERLVQPVTAVL
jgi:hypothetical protein